MAKALIPRIAAAVAVSCALLAPAAAYAQSANELKFPQYLNQRRSLTPPFTSSDKVPIVRNNQTYQVEGSSIVTTTGPQEIENKSIDCSKNTCENFPGIPLSAIPDCPDSSGQHLNFTNGVFSCGTTGGSGGGGTTTVALTADDGATPLTADDGSTTLTAN